MNKGGDPRLAHFVRDTLGCTCPETVFDRIALHLGGPGRMIAKIELGGRLLIYLVDADRGPDIARQLGAAVQRGVVERDSRGFNRFRLVVLASAAEAWIDRAEQVFRQLPQRDARTHLHIVEPAVVATFLPR